MYRDSLRLADYISSRVSNPAPCGACMPFWTAHGLSLTSGATVRQSGIINHRTALWEQVRQSFRKNAGETNPDKVRCPKLTRHVLLQQLMSLLAGVEAALWLVQIQEHKDA